MRVRPYALTALSTACALGTDHASAMQTLQRGESGLRLRGPDLGLPFSTWFGEVPGELAALPTPLSVYDNRQARLLQHLLLPLRDALDNAKTRWGAHRVGIALGTTTGGVGSTEEHVATWPNATPPTGWFTEQHNLHVTADLAAKLTGVTGPTLVQSSACSSSSKVFGTARRLLDLGVVDAMIVGGVDSRCRFTLLGFHGLGILSAERCRPLSVDRDGINLGEGGGLLLMERDGDALAWLRGVGETSDAHHMTQPHPKGAGLAHAITLALAQAGLDPSDVDLVNAHATGTQLNDAAESLALASALPHRPLVTATKAYTGHTLGACGGLEICMLVHALREGWAPATLTDGELAPEAAKLQVQRHVVHAPFRHALNVSAAFAGHNAAVLLAAP
jgi:3-oxoacyl-[acyl-carrier-protein] synthase-1